MALLTDRDRTIPSPDSGLRKTAFVTGLIVFAIGLGLSGFLFVQIVRALHDPTPYTASLDRWEFFIRGRGPIENFTPEPGDVERLRQEQGNTSDDFSITPAAPPPGASHAPELKLMDAVVERGARWTAIGIISIFVLSLCSIAAGTASAGARLMRAGLRPALVYSDDDIEEHRDTGLKKRPRL